MSARTRLAQLCARLYDSATPEGERRDLSLEVSILRSKIARCKDPLAAMMRASTTDEEE